MRMRHSILNGLMLIIAALPHLCPLGIYQSQSDHRLEKAWLSGNLELLNHHPYIRTPRPASALPRFFGRR